jgi:serine/threonine protein kinase
MSDDAINQFEAAWLRGEKPRIEDYLVDQVDADFVGPLATLDLSFRLLCGESKRVEDYLCQFDCLRSIKSWILKLITSEYAERTRRHEEISPVEYFTRFPDLASSLWLNLGIEPPPGTRIAQFEILEVLGRGTFGIVCGANDHQLQRIVALKLPRSARYFDATREAQSASVLRHWGIAQVYQVVTSDTCPALVTEFIPGGTLENWLRKHRLTFRESAEVIWRVAEAVDYAHRYGVYHDDLKPANIIMREDKSRPRLGATSEPVIVDFGLARRTDLSMQTMGGVGGTPAYMAPERFEQSIADDDPDRSKSDVYSLGVVLYELLVGSNRFHEQLEMGPRPQAAAHSHSSLARNRQVQLPRPRAIIGSIPSDLEAICLRAIERDVKKRYASAGEMADDLKRWLNHDPIPWLHPNFWQSAMWVRRNPLLTLSTAALVTLIIALLLAWSSVVAVLRQERTKVDLRQFGVAVAAHESHAALQAAVDRANKSESDLHASLRWLVCDLQPSLAPGDEAHRKLLTWAEEQLDSRARLPFSIETLYITPSRMTVPSHVPWVVADERNTLPVDEKALPSLTEESYASNEGLLALVCQLQLDLLKKTPQSERDADWQQRRSAWREKAVRCHEAIESQKNDKTLAEKSEGNVLPPITPPVADEEPHHWLGSLLVDWITEHEGVLPVHSEDSLIARLVVVGVYATGLGTVVSSVLLLAVWLAGKFGYAYSIARWFLPKGVSKTGGVLSMSFLGVVFLVAQFYLRACGRNQILPERESSSFPPAIRTDTPSIEVEQLLEALKRENAEVQHDPREPGRPLER